MGKVYGSITQTSATRCNITLASGVYMQLELPSNERDLRNLRVIRQYRIREPDLVAFVDRHTLSVVRESAHKAILTHRGVMHRLPPAPDEYLPRPFQLNFSLT